MLAFKSKASIGVALVAVGIASMAGSAIAGTASGNVVMSATLTSGCEVQAGAIDFGSFSNLSSTGDKTADSGTTFKVACSNDVSPTIASTTTRSLSDGGGTPKLLPFNLSLTAGAAADDLPSTTPGALTITKDGTLKTVILYAKVLASNFSGANALPANTYTRTVVVDVGY